MRLLLGMIRLHAAQYQSFALRQIQHPIHRVVQCWHGVYGSDGSRLASSYLALWVIARTEGIDAAANAMHYVAPVGEKERYVKLEVSHIEPFL